MTAEFTWFRASAELSGGDRVRFVSAHGDIPAGTIATVVENSLNEMQPVLIVKPDTDEAPPPDDGDGNVWLDAPERRSPR